MVFEILSFLFPSAMLGAATPNKNFSHLKYNQKAHAAYPQVVT